MDNIYKNRKIVLFCILLILIFFSLTLYKKTNVNNKEEVIEYEYLKNYKSNEFVNLYVTEEDMVKKYLNEYRNNMIYNIEDAYNSLNRSYRSIRFGTLDGYKKYVESILNSSMFSMEVDRYSVSRINGYKVYNIYDKSGHQYLFKELSIMNYEVYLDENTVVIE